MDPDWRCISYWKMVGFLASGLLVDPRGHTYFASNQLFQPWKAAQKRNLLVETDAMINFIPKTSASAPRQLVECSSNCANGFDSAWKRTPQWAAIHWLKGLLFFLLGVGIDIVFVLVSFWFENTWFQYVSCWGSCGLIKCVIGDFHQRLVTPFRQRWIAHWFGDFHDHPFHDHPVIPGFLFIFYKHFRRIIDPDIWKASHQGVEWCSVIVLKDQQDFNKVIYVQMHFFKAQFRGEIKVLLKRYAALPAGKMCSLIRPAPAWGMPQWYCWFFGNPAPLGM